MYSIGLWVGIVLPTGGPCSSATPLTTSGMSTRAGLLIGLCANQRDKVAIALAAQLARGPPSRIALTDLEHYSNHYAWRRLARPKGWSLEIVCRNEGEDWNNPLNG